MADRKRSKVWLHFNKCSDNGDYARCNLCGMKYKATGGNTSNLRKHLVKHKIFLKAEECTIFARPTRTDVTSAPSPASDTGETGSAAGGDNSDNDSSEASSSSSAAGPAECCLLQLWTRPGLGLDEHSLILDVRTRWNSLFLMVERFIEQYPAIQAASRDPRIKKAMDRDRLLRVSDDDMSKCEDFVDTMRVLYTSTLAVSADRSATAGQILPILDKLRAKFEVKDEDSAFKKAIKEKVWADLSHRYTEETNKELRLFLEEATALDPRFKGKIQDEAVWTRLENEAVVLFTGDKIGEVTQQEGEEVAEGEEMPEAPEKRKKKLSALGELFQDEDQEVLFQREIDTQAPSLAEKAKNELLIYQRFPAVLSSVHPLLWWWQKRDQMPMLASLAKKYLCVQASSTPSERVFSTAGDTVSVERARVLPKKVDMLKCK
uniref:BED-type domain-containing protein n=1 Tax=Iconisemion striatum TaxID=60296 RepID=A0A1A7Z5Q1_9TELE